MAITVFRLFRQFKPRNYCISLKIDPDELIFSGLVDIFGDKVDGSSQYIAFHQKNLHFSHAKLIYHDQYADTLVDVSSIEVLNDKDEVRIHAQAALVPGSYTVSLRFSGSITRSMVGIYLCSFMRGGVKKKVVMTQFESYHARRAFPCIDEPKAKATYDLTLMSPKGQPIISNTQIYNQTESNNLFTTTFVTTPKMSTYLLAFVIGEFEYREKTTNKGVLVRAHATPDNVANVLFTLKTAVRALEYLSEYFDIQYPLIKCDLIAVPDFASKGMENWGCITFNEDAMLVDARNTSLSSIQAVALTVVHEITHQWFGNLVTMRWWNDLWLNESFADWLSYLVVDGLFPEWNILLQFAANEQYRAYHSDALKASHPIEVTINHPAEIPGIFDEISYQKGASILQMLYEFLGHENFRNGLHLYLEKHAYGNAGAHDLWVAFEAVSKLPVDSFMNMWVKHTGYPIIQATVKGQELLVTQKRFYLNPVLRQPDNTIWPIPLSPSVHIKDAMLATRNMSFSLPSSQKPLTLNINRSSLVHILYDQSHLLALTESVRSKQLQPIDRLGLIYDMFEAAKGAYVDIVATLKLLESYIYEDDPMIWKVINQGLCEIMTIVDNSELDLIDSYARSLVAEQIKRLGWDAAHVDAVSSNLLRPIVLSIAAQANDPSVIKEANRRFNQIEDPDELHPDLREMVFMAIAMNGGLKEHAQMLKWYSDAPSIESREALGRALMSFKSTECISESLSIITNAAVMPQDITLWIKAGLSNKYATLIIWRWLTAEWQWLDDQLGEDYEFARLPLYIGQVFTDDELQDEYVAFFRSLRVNALLARSIRQGTEEMKWRSAWKKRDLVAIKAYFSLSAIRA